MTVGATEMAPLPQQMGAEGGMPAGLGGAMDGEIIPKNKIEEIKMMLEPLRAKYGDKLQQIRPVNEFIAVSIPTKDNYQIRVTRNIPYFQVNYLCTFSVAFFVSILIDPTKLFFIALMAAAWFFFLKKNEEENWKVNVGGIDLGKSQRMMVMGLITLIFTLFLLGQLVFSLVGSIGAFCVAHAVCNHSRESIEDAEAIDPASDRI